MIEDADLQAHRKARLRELIDNACGGVVARLAERIDRSDSYVGRMLYPVDKKQSRPVSDKLAIVIERVFSLKRGWFDLPVGESLPYPTANYPRADSTVQSAEESRREPSSMSAIVWPFQLAGYRRLQTLTASLGRRAGEALRDMDAHLDIVMIKWEREAARQAAANRA